MTKKTNPSFRFADHGEITGLIDVISNLSEEEKEKSKKIMADRINQNQLICVIYDNKIAGFIGWAKNYGGDSQSWFIEQITVKNDLRGNGIGSKLLSYFLEFCKKEKISSVYASVQNKNERSLNMFRGAGGIITKDKKGDNIVKFIY